MQRQTNRGLPIFEVRQRIFSNRMILFLFHWGVEKTTDPGRAPAGKAGARAGHAGEWGGKTHFKGRDQKKRE